MHGLVTGQDPRNRCGDLELKLENPLGFFESERLVNINDSLLQALGCHWDKPPLLPANWDKSPLLEALQHHRSNLSSYALENDWVDKDPRLCITYPAFMHILLRRIPLVVALREPLEVATSLYLRNGFSLNRGLVLWWIYNFHIASQLCSKDLLISYKTLLSLDHQGLQSFFGPFLEIHNRQSPSDGHTQALIASLLKPELNRASYALTAENRAFINPHLLKISQNIYNNIIHSGDQLACFKRDFDSLPRIVLECSARDQLLPESQFSSLQNDLNNLESTIQDLSLSRDQRERDVSLLQQQLNNLHNSRSWQLTAPFRSLVKFLSSLRG